MKRFLYSVLMTVVAITMLESCLGNSVFDEYKEWREKNEDWYTRQAQSGQYTVVNASWDPSSQVLMRWHNDTMQTKNNLKPMLTSTVDVKYQLNLYDGTLVDSSYGNSTPADSIYRSAVNENVEGWMIGLTHMHVGDSCTIIVPYQQGYGSTMRSDLLKPYSMLVFGVKLMDINKYKAN